jgi:hypothetical protein
MVMFLAGNVRENFARIRVDHHRVSASGNVEAVILGIQGDIVHAALAADMKGVFDSPCALRGNAGAKRERDECEQKGNRCIPRVHSILQ